MAAAAPAAVEGVPPEIQTWGTEASALIPEAAVLNQEAVENREASGACA